MSDETYFTFSGGAVKSLGSNKIGGRVVTFSGARDPDRELDFFDGSTDFWLNSGGERRPILYRHGIDGTIKRRRFGEVQLSKAADGIWAQGYIAGKDEHSLKLMQMAEAGQLNWSTGAVGHLVAKSLAMGAMHVDEWPIAEVSLCPPDTVAEPRNIVSLKEYVVSENVADFDSLIVLPFSQSREHDRYVQERAKEAEQRFWQIRVDLMTMQHEQKMRELGLGG